MYQLCVVECLILLLQKQLKMMHAECEQAKKTMKEANKMKSEVCMMKRLASCPVLWCMRDICTVLFCTCTTA